MVASFEGFFHPDMVSREAIWVGMASLSPRCKTFAKRLDVGHLYVCAALPGIFNIPCATTRRVLGRSHVCFSCTSLRLPQCHMRVLIDSDDLHELELSFEPSDVAANSSERSVPAKFYSTVLHGRNRDGVWTKRANCLRQRLELSHPDDALSDEFGKHVPVWMLKRALRRFGNWSRKAYGRSANRRKRQSSSKTINCLGFFQHPICSRRLP